jgi:hypothetical protein
MKAAIMQPYFLPYLGYFQLIAAVDVFVVYDNIQYTKKGWINRNRLLRNGADRVFTVPLKNDSDYLDIRDRRISSDFRRDKLLNQIGEAYRKAPHFADVFALIAAIVNFEECNLFGYVHHSILTVCQYIGITTPIVVSSSIDVDHSLKSQDRVIAICRAMKASHYINPIGGLTLYAPSTFNAAGIELSFLRSQGREYRQLGGEFVPSLSILDVLMFNSQEDTRNMLKDFELLRGSDAVISSAIPSPDTRAV